MSQGKQLGVEAVLTHEKPASQALHDLMQAIASDELGNLQAMHQAKAVEFGAE